jgi:5'-nucleotidase
MKLILVSNDDGYASAGIRALQAALAPHATVVICAPEINQSATSHALSLHRSLRLRAVSNGVFALDGTPADCVYVALHSGSRVLARRPDLVVSGINHGLNLGSDVFYSGTVAAAREGAMRGVPALAVSADAGADLAAAAALTARLALATIADHARPSAAADSGAAPDERAPGAPTQAPPPSPFPRVPLLNVNIPRGKAWEVRATRLGARLYPEDVDYRKDPRGREYLWLGGSGAVRHDLFEGSDTDAFDAGIVSITPLCLDISAPHHGPLAARIAADAQNG